MKSLKVVNRETDRTTLWIRVLLAWYEVGLPILATIKRLIVKKIIIYFYRSIFPSITFLSIDHVWECVISMCLMTYVRFWSVSFLTVPAVEVLVGFLFISAHFWHARPSCMLPIFWFHHYLTSMFPLPIAARSTRELLPTGLFFSVRLRLPDFKFSSGVKSFVRHPILRFNSFTHPPSRVVILGNKTHLRLPAVVHQCWCWVTFHFLRS